MSEHQRVECLVFETPTGRYAVEVGRLRELVALETVTDVPEAPASVAGITTIRGEVVVVLSGAALFDTEETMLAVLDRDDDRRLVGLAVGDVAGVRTFDLDAVTTPDAFGGDGDADRPPTKAVVLPLGDRATGDPTFVLDATALGEHPPDPPRGTTP